MAESTNNGVGIGLIAGVLVVLVVGVLFYMFSWGGTGNGSPKSGTQVEVGVDSGTGSTEGVSGGTSGE